MYGFYRVACAVPCIKVGDVEFNTNEIAQLIKQAENKNAAVIVFPELSITGYTCADLFFQSQLIDSVTLAIKHLCKVTEEMGIIAIVGAP
ncbi:MAG: nitrilase-related carbon-nitrogen hydrolase, partial [Lentisphaeria bacterium]